MGLRRVAGLSAWLGLLLAAPLFAVLASDWPRFQGPDGNGLSPETGLARSWPAGGPKVLWTIPVEPGFGAPSIRDGKVYYLGRLDDKHRDYVHCVDLSTGRQEWVYDYYAYGTISFGGRGQPTVDAQYLYTLGPTGDLHCLDRVTAKRVWSLNIVGRPRNPDDPRELPPKGQPPRDTLGLGLPKAMPRWGLTQSPLLYHDVVIVAPQSDLVALAAFDKGTGQLKWKSPPLGRLAFSHQTPALANLAGLDQVVLCGNVLDGPPAILGGFDAQTGKKLWSVNIAKYNVIIPSPVPVAPDRVFVAGGYQVGCFMLRIRNNNHEFTAEKLFANANCTPQVQNVILYKEHLYANSYDQYHNRNGAGVNRGLECLNLDGTIRWATGPERDFDQGPFLIADGLIYILHGGTGVLYLAEASPDGYRELASVKVFPEVRDQGKPTPKIFSPLALADGKLVLRNDKEMKCLDVRTAK